MDDTAHSIERSFNFLLSKVEGFPLSKKYRKIALDHKFYNYAGNNCNAKVIRTSKQTKRAKAVLEDSPDSYMTIKCDHPNKHIIIKLCEEININLISLANYEYFSSSPKNFRISASNDMSMSEWASLGDFVALNTKERQFFKRKHWWAYPKYYRYLKIEFLSHYGKEHYCTTSSIQVHGVSMMDDYRLVSSGFEFLYDHQSTPRPSPHEEKAAAEMSFMQIEALLKEASEFHEIPLDRHDLSHTQYAYPLSYLRHILACIDLNQYFASSQAQLKALYEKISRSLDPQFKHDLESSFSLYLSTLNDLISCLKLWIASKLHQLRRSKYWDLLLKKISPTSAYTRLSVQRLSTLYSSLTSIATDHTSFFTTTMLSASKTSPTPSHSNPITYTMWRGSISPTPPYSPIFPFYAPELSHLDPNNASSTLYFSSPQHRSTTPVVNLSQLSKESISKECYKHWRAKFDGLIEPATPQKSDMSPDDTDSESKKDALQIMDSIIHTLCDLDTINTVEILDSAQQEAKNVQEDHHDATCHRESSPSSNNRPGNANLGDSNQHAIADIDFSNKEQALSQITRDGSMKKNKTSAADYNNAGKPHQLSGTSPNNITFEPLSRMCLPIEFQCTNENLSLEQLVNVLVSESDYSLPDTLMYKPNAPFSSSSPSHNGQAQPDRHPAASLLKTTDLIEHEKGLSSYKGTPKNLTLPKLSSGSKVHENGNIFYHIEYKLAALEQYARVNSEFLKTLQEEYTNDIFYYTSLHSNSTTKAFESLKTYLLHEHNEHEQHIQSLNRKISNQTQIVWALLLFNFFFLCVFVLGIMYKRYSGASTATKSASSNLKKSLSLSWVPDIPTDNKDSLRLKKTASNASSASLDPILSPSI